MYIKYVKDYVIQCFYIFKLFLKIIDITQYKRTALKFRIYNI